MQGDIWDAGEGGRGEGGGGFEQLGKQLPLIIAEQKCVTYT